MSAPVDVLAVMALAASAATDYDALTERGMTRAELWAELIKARAAVAELVEAAARLRRVAGVDLSTSRPEVLEQMDAALAKFAPTATNPNPET